MRTPTLISLALLLTLPLAAGAQVYSWKDASGKTIYSDKPPLEKKVQTREVAVGSKGGSEPAAPVTATAKPAEGIANGVPPAKSEAQLKAESEARQKLCDNARMRLIQLESTQGVLVTKDEKGQPVNGRTEKPNKHDILTGSRPDGTAFPGAQFPDMTCGNWTKSGPDGSAMTGHFDRAGPLNAPWAVSWNSSHPTLGCNMEKIRPTGGDGLFYCFAEK